MLWPSWGSRRRLQELIRRNVDDVNHRWVSVDKVEYEWFSKKKWRKIKKCEIIYKIISAQRNTVRNRCESLLFLKSCNCKITVFVHCVNKDTPLWNSILSHNMYMRVINSPACPKQRQTCLWWMEACPGWSAWKQHQESLGTEWSLLSPGWCGGRSIVKDSWACCFLLSLWGQWVPNTRLLSFNRLPPPSERTDKNTNMHMCGSVDCLSRSLKPRLKSAEK